MGSFIFTRYQFNLIVVVFLWKHVRVFEVYIMLFGGRCEYFSHDANFFFQKLF